MSTAIVPYAPTQVVYKSKPSRRRSTPRRGRTANLAPTSLSYRGPTRLPRGVQANDTYSAQLNYGQSSSANGSGTLAATFDAYVMASNSPDWAGFVALWSEYRILSMKLTFVPWNKYNVPTTTTLGPVYTVEDRQNNTSVTTLAGMQGYDSIQIHEVSTKFSRVMKMNGTDEANWVDSSQAPDAASRMYIKLLSLGNTASITMYDYLAVTMVQFRGRK